jgi:hypothetical protein
MTVDSRGWRMTTQAPSKTTHVCRSATHRRYAIPLRTRAHLSSCAHAGRVSERHRVATCRASLGASLEACRSTTLSVRLLPQLLPPANLQRFELECSSWSFVLAPCLSGSGSVAALMGCRRSCSVPSVWAHSRFVDLCDELQWQNAPLRGNMYSEAAGAEAAPRHLIARRRAKQRPPQR